MSTEIQFKPEVLSLVSDLISISSSTIMWRDEENIRIAMAEPNKTLAYIVKVPFESLDIPTTLAFYDYKEFFSLYGSLKDPSLLVSEDGQKIIVSSSKSRIEYNLSPVEKVNIGTDDKPLSPKVIQFKDPTHEFVVDSKTLSEIKKAISLLKLAAEDTVRLTISGEEDCVVFKISNNDRAISWDSMVPSKKLVDTTDTFDLILFADHISRIPSGYDYKVEVAAMGAVAGMIRFTIQNIDDDVNAEIYTMVKKESK